METINTRSFARAGLLGNPSDSYLGKMLSFAFLNLGSDDIDIAGMDDGVWRNS